MRKCDRENESTSEKVRECESLCPRKREIERGHLLNFCEFLFWCGHESDQFVEDTTQSNQTTMNGIGSSDTLEAATGEQEAIVA